MPNDLATAKVTSALPIEEFWSRFTDYHNENKWAALAFDKTGGAFRFIEGGVPVYATADYRLINDWLIVLADYTHEFIINGNLFPNTSTGLSFDTVRTKAQGVVPRINSADSFQSVSGGFTQADRDLLLLAADHARAANSQTKKQLEPSE